MSTIVENRPATAGSEADEARDKLGGLVDQLDRCDINNETATGAGGDPQAVMGPGAVMKHPLQNAWTLWFFKSEKGQSWELNQRKIITVNTVEDFWSLYNHIECASNIPSGCDYSLFKEGIFPDWEDPRNKNGGRWIINVDKKQRAKNLDSYWLEILFFLIGEHADQYAYQVNGAAVNVRGKGDKLAVWLADTSDSNSIIRIGKMLKDRLNMDPEEKIGFTVHEDERSKASSSKKARFNV